MIRSVRTFLLAMIVTVSTTSTIWATPDKSVDTYLVGNGNGIFFSDNSQYFFSIDKMTPGDSQSKSIKIKNKNSSPYKLYMRIKESKAKEEYSVLDKLSLNINLDGENIYTDLDFIEEKLIEIGEIKEKSTHNFEATIRLDGSSVGNEYANKEGIVEWEFIATNIKEDNINDDNDNNESSNTNIDSINTTKPPKTGDSGIVFYLVLGIISTILLVTTSKRKNIK